MYTCAFGLKARTRLSAFKHSWSPTKVSIEMKMSNPFDRQHVNYLDSYDHVARIANILDSIVQIIQSINSQRPFAVSRL